MSENNEEQNIVIVAHKFLTQPDDELIVFLNDRKYTNVMHIRHSFSDAPDRSSYYSWYKDGVLHKEFRTWDYKSLPEPLLYAKELFFTCKWIIASRVRWNSYIGMDGLLILFGNLLRGIGRVRKTMFWSMDFVPESRFRSGLKNKAYHWINTLSYKSADEMWDISPRMAEAREKYLGMEEGDYKLRKVVPYGMWVDRVRRYSYEQCEQNTLVFMGHLIEKQGVQVVIRAIPAILKRLPEFRFKIIGGGNYKEDAEQLARNLNVSQVCSFLGKIDDIRIVEDEIAKSAVAIAPYVKALDTWTYYADPGKVKTYLACGVPVLLTDIPWNAKDIEEKGCGKIITEDVDDIVEKILLLMDKNRNESYRKNAIEYSRSFDYENIFHSLV